MTGMVHCLNHFLSVPKTAKQFCLIIASSVVQEKLAIRCFKQVLKHYKISKLHSAA